jgi:hypothetical protein
LSAPLLLLLFCWSRCAVCSSIHTKQSHARPFVRVSPQQAPSVPCNSPTPLAAAPSLACHPCRTSPPTGEPAPASYLLDFLQSPGRHQKTGAQHSLSNSFAASPRRTKSSSMYWAAAAAMAQTSLTANEALSGVFGSISLASWIFLLVSCESRASG